MDAFRLEIFYLRSRRNGGQVREKEREDEGEEEEGGEGGGGEGERG